ncbi:MAG: indole-3-glycerol-phosphate synthase [Thaumarchaeota archaeon]|jgi:indole-3-glycerol phosphate synthase|nr:indole-3-glycerol-phosphate synthase [Nitrososphaerota archaeon]MBT3743786.1 indole-3-glycerol-phosphate synthase [Nitrososphaerota archaeon]MBT4057722.1 indole-3-glycerol-phosphate synthase [Nitrososphaerota archaeon]MBT4175590.1 indole-3-glycerol-phosphate synthase [Nitrososphaerota archaeon]MBT4509690.1 indole-3-glycerol-phosphate synthase [Nitrososphaerota archaeon]
MENILEKLVNNSRKAIDNGVYNISESLSNSGMDLGKIIINSQHAPLITEVKFSSPALGNIRKVSDPIDIAIQMVNGGASALSVLTQPFLFDGSPEVFMKVRKVVEIPMLMKDITVDKIQIDAAKKIGADYFLLIQSIFDKKMVPEMDELIDYGHKNGVKVIVEAHTTKEFENACKTNADIVGINNRNLDTLKIDLNTTKNILDKSDSSKIIISESGIESNDDIRFLHKCGARGYLVGTAIMKNDNIEQTVRGLVNSI